MIRNDRPIREIWPQDSPDLSQEIRDDTPPVVGGILLGERTVDALSIKDGTARGLTGGYDVLAKVLQTSDLHRFFVGRIANVQRIARPIPEEALVGALLDRYESTTFGHALVKFRPNPRIVSVVDVLRLYQHGRLDSGLRLQDVATRPLPAVPRSMPLEEAARIMVEKRVRRLFVEGEPRSVITDRSLIRVLFSPEMLEWAGEHPGRLPPLTIGALEPRPVLELDVAMRVPAAAVQFDLNAAEAIFCSAGIVTPWDLVMKPFARGDLTFI
jgi:CBS domain-containing protein